MFVFDYALINFYLGINDLTSNYRKKKYKQKLNQKLLFSYRLFALFLSFEFIIFNIDN